MALLAACVRRGLRVLSAMGAGARADPTRIRIADIRESSNDPLSRAVIFSHGHGLTTTLCSLLLSLSRLFYLKFLTFTPSLDTQASCFYYQFILISHIF